MKKIEPSIVKGTRDFLPEEMAKRNFVMNTIRGVFERFGYAPLETPILSPAETILGKYGEEGDRLTYHFKDAGDREIALPYDLTVPFARYVAAHWPELPMPFKRYQIQRVWRAEKPQKGRLREFYQCDIDVVGTRSLLVEAEVARVIVEVFTALGIKDFRIKVNSRRLMNEVLGTFGADGGSAPGVIRAIDKLDKIGLDEVVAELAKLGVREPEKLMALLAPAEDNEQTLAHFGSFDTSEIGTFLSHAKELGVADEYIRFDPSLARGLDYYTGLVFEVVATKSDFGSICGGGRYDNLTGLFEVNAPRSATVEVSGMGVAFGFERIMLLMEESGLLEDAKRAADALVTVFEESMIPDALAVYRELVDSGAAAELYFEPAKLEKQLKYADKKGIRFAVIQGPAEKAEGMLLVKNLGTGAQEKIPAGELAEYVRTP